MATPSQLTLLDLVQLIDQYTVSAADTAATAAHLINGGQVLLCGTFAGARIELSTPVRAGNAGRPNPLALCILKRKHGIPR